jgi:hypothetical protein
VPWLVIEETPTAGRVEDAVAIARDAAAPERRET